MSGGLPNGKTVIFRLVGGPRDGAVSVLVPKTLKKNDIDRLQRTAAGIPRRDAKLIKGHLEQIAKGSDEPIRVQSRKSNEHIGL